jgi:hypothetical protein
MIISRRSPRTGQINEMDLPITEQQLRDWMSRRMLIQDAMPNLTPEQREFIMTGYTPEDWAAIFPACPQCGETLDDPDRCDECGWLHGP